MERLLTRLEHRYGRYAPQNITIWLVGLSGFAAALIWMQPAMYDAFVLDVDRVLAGEVWRLVTFLFMPWQLGGGVLNTIFMLFALLFLYTIGTSLEAEWGSFRFDLFYLLGALGTIAGAFLVGRTTNTYIYLSLLLAFAVVFPDYEILLFLVLPVKMKWVGVFDAALLAWSFATGTNAERVAIAVSLANFFLFCGGTLVGRLRGRAQQAGRARALERFRAATGPAQRKPRVCAKCGRSEADEPALEFRVCDCQEKCRGRLTEYCIEHARAH